jgi:hypothetical protein
VVEGVSESGFPSGMTNQKGKGNGQDRGKSKSRSGFPAGMTNQKGKGNGKSLDAKFAK